MSNRHARHVSMQEFVKKIGWDSHSLGCESKILVRSVKKVRASGLSP